MAIIIIITLFFFFFFFFWVLCCARFFLLTFQMNTDMRTSFFTSFTSLSFFELWAIFWCVNDIMHGRTSMWAFKRAPCRSIRNANTCIPRIWPTVNEATHMNGKVNKSRSKTRFIIWWKSKLKEKKKQNSTEQTNEKMQGNFEVDQWPATDKNIVINIMLGRRQCHHKHATPARRYIQCDRL